MKIYIKLSSGRRFKIPAPIGLVKAALSFGGFGLSISRKYISQEQRQYVDCIDFKELRRSMDVLRDYKGLKMVEVKTEDGTEVIIVI